jgi:BirA family biotin operon repressor/biotin-[acetyl-CoA-carboxylase] ligase
MLFRAMSKPAESHDHLLNLLRGQTDWVSGQAICAALHCSRAAIWKQIEGLRQDGYVIEARPRMGYRITVLPEAPRPEEVRLRLTTRTFGRDMTWLPAVDSTNRWMAEKAETGAPEGCVIAADTQTAGRGRLDRTWFSPPGLNLYTSILLRPVVPLDRVASLALVLGLAVRRALRTLAPAIEPRLKWPNDLWVDNKKISGILCEMRAEPERVHHVVAGIGLNVNTEKKHFPKALQTTSTSLKIAGGRDFARAEVLAVLLNELEPLYRIWIKDGLSPFQDELNEADLLKGRAISLVQGTRTLTGTAMGVAPDGSLLLKTAEGIQSIYSGDVSIKSISGLRK